MLKLSRSVVLLLGGAATLSLGACAHGGKKGDTAYVARDVGMLYSAAKRSMDIGDYEQAAKLFDEVERQHPYSVWARRAQLMSAFNYYLSQEIYRGDQLGPAVRVDPPGQRRSALRAISRSAMSYYEQIADVTRDQSITQSASDAFGELIRRYPESRYASDARLKLDTISDHLAGKEMEIGRFYQRSGQWLAATYRFRSVVDKFRRHQSHARGARAPGGMLYRARNSRRSVEGLGRARRQLSGHLLVPAVASAADQGASAHRRRDGRLGQPGAWAYKQGSRPTALPKGPKANGGTSPTSYPQSRPGTKE